MGAPVSPIVETQRTGRTASLIAGDPRRWEMCLCTRSSCWPCRVLREMRTTSNICVVLCFVRHPARGDVGRVPTGVNLMDNKLNVQLQKPRLLTAAWAKVP